MRIPSPVAIERGITSTSRVTGQVSSRSSLFTRAATMEVTWSGCVVWINSSSGVPAGAS